jgi:hypothetical protein
MSAVSVPEKKAEKKSSTMSRPSNRPKGTSSFKKNSPPHEKGSID